MCVSSAAVNGDVNYVRRVSLNVARVVSIASGVLQLGAPLLAGVPTAGMQVSRLAGFVDREGGGWFQEWSALFVMEGEQGDRVLYHYPRLQAMQGSAESLETLAAPLERVRLAGAFRALPVKDANDGETVRVFPQLSARRDARDLATGRSQQTSKRCEPDLQF